MENNKYYVYLHIKETTGEPFYVGKGFGNRFLIKQHRSLHWNRIVNKYGYDTIFLETNLSEKESLEREIYWIERIGRKDLDNGPLVNFTNGGDGLSGYIKSEETRRKISEGNKGRIVSKETREKMSKSLKGIGKGRIVSKEQREQISKTLTGVKHSEERKLKNSISHKGRISPRKGIIMTDEQKKKISDSKKQFFEKECEICNKMFEPGQHREKKTCSKECLIKFKSINKHDTLPSNTQIVLDTQTGVYYDSATELSKLIPISRSYLTMMLSGKRINKTAFIYA